MPNWAFLTVFSLDYYEFKWSKLRISSAKPDFVGLSHVSETAPSFRRYMDSQNRLSGFCGIRKFLSFPDCLSWERERVRENPKQKLFQIQQNQKRSPYSRKCRKQRKKADSVSRRHKIIAVFMKFFSIPFRPWRYAYRYDYSGHGNHWYLNDGFVCCLSRKDAVIRLSVSAEEICLYGKRKAASSKSSNASSHEI